MRPRRQRGWRKSSHSGANEGCVEVLEGPHIWVRDSKFTELGHIAFGVNAWTVFVASVNMPRSSPD